MKKIKILYVDNGVSFGGAIISISHLVRHLDPNMFVPIIVSEMDNQVLLQHVPNHVKMYKIKHWINYDKWSRINSFAEMFRYRTLKRIFILACMIPRIFTDIIYFVRFLWVCLLEKPDIIHVNNGFDIEEAYLAAGLMSIPCIVHMRGQSGVSSLRKLISKLPAIYISVSKWIESWLVREWGVPQDKILVIGDPVFFPVYSGRDVKSIYSVSPTDRCFGIFGRVIPWKGQEFFVKAAIEVLNKYPYAKAFVVGDAADGTAEYFDQIKKIAKDSPVGDRIFFTGYISNVSEYYQMMDIVVHASITPEPFGMVINEAMFYGVPVIASNEGGPLDIIDDGVNGLLIKPGDPVFLEEAINKLLFDDLLRVEMGRRAREKIIMKYDVIPYTEKMEKLYRKIGTKR